MDGGHLDLLRLIYAFFIEKVMMELCYFLTMVVLIELCYDYLLLGFLALDETLVDGLDLLDHGLLPQDYFCG